MTQPTTAIPATFFRVIEDDLVRVQEFFDTEIISPVQLVMETTRYNLSSGGKRVRPSLVLLSAKILGFHGDGLIPLAASVEMVHTATLVHDDLVDGASMRRGRLTTKKMWGEGVSVLTGDYLFTKGFHILSSQGDVVLPQILCDVAVKMCEGELLQISRRGDVETPEEDYLRVIYGKTATLIEGCCAIGARVAGAPDAAAKSLREYGMRVGMAFQMVDDLLNFVGDESEVGKPVWNDLKEGNFSLPILAALKRAPEPARSELTGLLVRSESDESAVPRILEIVNQFEGVNYARARAQKYVDDAKAELENLPAGEYREALNDLADYVIQRDR